MSQLENKMDDFVPFGGQARTEYQEDELAIPHAVSAAAINALDELMFPKDDQGQWPSGCQTYFAVQRTSGPESEKDYFLLGGDGLVSCIDQIEDEVPYSRDGADWGESDKALAFKVYSEPPTLLTFHELAPNGIDLLRDDDGFVSDAPSEAVEKIFNDPLCTMPAILALTEVELKVEAAIIELEMEHDGVKTEFQITEVKRGSFAYDQGARFDVKVLTDGYDCGNGHFCADLDDAHGFCEGFADDIAGHGESLDDMCEDRSEVASAVQDAHTGERYHEDEQRDNSEIGD